MFRLLIFQLFLWIVLIMSIQLHAVQELVIFPKNNAKFRFMPSDNGSDIKAFSHKYKNGLLEIDFLDKTNQDNYLHVDLGKYELLPYCPGGYIEITADLDRPIMRLGVSLADPGKFWPTRQFIEAEGLMKAGRYTYRFYLDNITEHRAKKNKDHLYLFLHDLSGKSNGKASLKISSIKLMSQTSGWKKNKSLAYSKQFNWMKFEQLGKYYRGKYDKLIAWSKINSNPFIFSVSLNGEWKKKYCGDKTWDYKFLMDSSVAEEKFYNDAVSVQIPEPLKEMQKGGHYWYQRKVKLDFSPGEKAYLRFEDIADSAEIYVNGIRIGTQTSVRKRHEWVVENGSRHSNTWHKPIKEVMLWQHFSRCGIKCPFSPDDIPDGKKRMLLPVYTGEYEWPFAFDISDAVKNGTNTVSVRLYGNPVTNWWIYKHNNDRAAKNIFGILGHVRLMIDKTPVIDSVNRTVASRVDKTGLVTHNVSCKISSGKSGEIARCVLTGAGQHVDMKADDNGKYTADIKLPAGFEQYSLQVTAFDEEGLAVGQRTLKFCGIVVQLQKDKLYVNGDRFLIRGINGSLGIEWKNDRTVSRCEWLRLVQFYKQIGFNTLRLEGPTAQHIKDAFDAGLMVMPLYAAGSCNNTLTALGNLEKCDYDFNADGNREMSILLSECPNILMWNTGNENWHTPGYNDFDIFNTYLEKSREAVRKFDSYKRPTTYANLDMFNTKWFFSKGQDVIGYNSYTSAADTADKLRRMYLKNKKPIVITEWGFHDNQARALQDRKNNVADWEKRMIEKFNVLQHSPGMLGSFLYAYHGELEDDRGRDFLQKMMLPFELRQEQDSIILENRDVCPFRNLSVMLVTDTDVIESRYAIELQPKETLRIPVSSSTDTEKRIMVRYTTHRGLKHQFVVTEKNIIKY